MLPGFGALKIMYLPYFPLKKSISELISRQVGRLNLLTRTRVLAASTAIESGEVIPVKYGTLESYRHNCISTRW